MPRGSCSLPPGFTNVLDDVSDDHSVDLFEPSFSVTKEGDAQAKVGDVVNYTITLTNSSGPGTTTLTCTATDTLLGEVFNDVLPLGHTVLHLPRILGQYRSHRGGETHRYRRAQVTEQLARRGHDHLPA